MLDVKRQTFNRVFLDKLEIGDLLTINTQTNEYRFKVTDSIYCRGILFGDALRSKAYQAVLLYSVQEGLERISTDDRLIKVGSKALFLLEIHGNLAHLLTSTITSMELLRASNAWKHNLSVSESRIGMKSGGTRI